MCAERFAELWQEQGKDALEHLAKNNTEQFIKAAIGFLPKQVDIEL
jgi:hypothetical protein